MMPLGIHVMRDGIHLPEQLPTAPTKDLNIRFRLPVLFAVLGYLAERTEGVSR